MFFIYIAPYPSEMQPFQVHFFFLPSLQTHPFASSSIGHKYLRGMSLEVNICPGWNVSGQRAVDKAPNRSVPGRETLLWLLFNLLLQHTPLDAVCSHGIARMSRSRESQPIQFCQLWMQSDSVTPHKTPNSLADIQSAHIVGPGIDFVSRCTKCSLELNLAFGYSGSANDRIIRSDIFRQ